MKPETPVREVLQLLVEKSIGCVLVADQGRPVGIFSERDALVKLNCRATELGDRPISEFMTVESGIVAEDGEGRLCRAADGPRRFSARAHRR